MKIDLRTWEIWELLKQGSSNERNFRNSLRYSEFKEFIEIIEDYEVDLRGLINGGVLSVEDDPSEDSVLWKNDRVGIVLI